MLCIRSLMIWCVLIAVSFLAVACGSPAQEVISETPALSKPAADPATRPSGDAASHISAGQTAFDGGNLVEAEQEYGDAVTLDPKSARAQFGLGNVYVRLNRLADAEKAFKAALVSDSRMASAQANLGVVYYQMGQLPQAAAALDAALRLDPEDAATLYLLGAVRLQENNLPEAEKLLIRARDGKPNLPEVYYGLGVLYRLKGQKAEAIQSFQKFLSIGPGQDPAAMDFARQELKQLQGQ